MAEYKVEDFERVLDDDNNYGCDGCFFKENLLSDFSQKVSEQLGSCYPGYHFELKKNNKDGQI
jgi:hypothetical protein